MFVKSICTLLIGFVFITAQAQEVKINAGFLGDSIEIGQEVNFWITATYPDYLEVIFPDSLHSFAPFEYQSKLYEPTFQKEGYLYDSAVYQLQSFEIEPYQALQLPVVVLQDEDSLVLMSPFDSLAFKDLVVAITDTTALLTNSSYLEVPLAFNYPMLWIVIGVLIFAGIVVLVLFGKRIRTALKIRKLRKDYMRFNDRLTEHIHRLKEQPAINLAEGAMIDWKLFMERLETSPYSKLTTAEILEKKSNQELSDTLKTIDRMVYGGMTSDIIYKSFQSIEDFTQHRYQTKINELKDGRSNQQ